MKGDPVREIYELKKLNAKEQQKNIRERLEILKFVDAYKQVENEDRYIKKMLKIGEVREKNCLLYTSPSPRDLSTSRMPSSA